MKKDLHWKRYKWQLLHCCLQIEPSKGLKKAIEDDQKHKEKLVAKYEAVQKLYEELPKPYRKDLTQAFKGYRCNALYEKSNKS